VWSYGLVRQKRMHHISEPSKKIPVMAETDVLVVGSGPGGLSAAIAAAREGVTVMLVERFGCFGGNITQAMVEGIAWYRHEKTVDGGGIGVEFETRAKAMGASQKDPEALGELLDADMFKYVADTMVREAGIVPVLHCYAVDAVMEGDTIKGIITESKSGRQAIAAQSVIDATGDADVAFHAGAPYTKAEKSEMMEATVNFGCSGVDVERFIAYVKKNPSHIRDWARETAGKEDDLFNTYIEEPFLKAREVGEIPEGVKIFGFWDGITEAGEATNINVVRLSGIDCTDVYDLTRAEMEGRRQALLALGALKKYTPGFEHAKLRTFGSSVGTRESRKIRGEHTLTGKEVRNEARFSDSIGIFPEFLDAYGVVIIPTTGRYFQLPYGILLPQGVDNLLVAGRCVSGDRMAFAATRQMMCCCVSGQGAGVAAAESVKEGVSCREVDVSRVQKALKKQGVRIS
jgi:ribulose 1,5-bisphosphate synthetase/thiazole synthase